MKMKPIKEKGIWIKENIGIMWRSRESRKEGRKGKTVGYQENQNSLMKISHLRKNTDEEKNTKEDNKGNTNYHVFLK